MNTLICPTCGCSLVRLGVARDRAVAYRYHDQEYHFCCRACVDIFITDPEKYLQETSDLVVCPSCLAEKP
ncbi:MAG: YHS domain-containing protein, partial [bacterium]